MDFPDSFSCYDFLFPKCCEKVQELQAWNWNYAFDSSFTGVERCKPWRSQHIPVYEFLMKESTRLCFYGVKSRMPGKEKQAGKWIK